MYLETPKVYPAPPASCVLCCVAFVDKIAQPLHSWDGYDVPHLVVVVVLPVQAP